MEENQTIEDQEKIELQDELIEELEDQYEESESFTSSKIFLLVSIGFVSFFIFLILLFPIEEVIKSFISDFSKKSGVVIEFKDLKFPIFGAKSLDGLTIQPDSNLILKSEEVYLDAKLFDLIKFIFDGELDLLGFRYDSQDISILIKSILISGKLTDINERISKINGDLNITLKGGEIVRAPEIPLLGEIKKVEIQNGIFLLKFRSGKLLIDQGNLNTGWFRFQLSGQIRINDNIPFSSLDIKVCATPQEKFAQERPDIAGILTLAPQENGRACIPIKGTIRSPTVEGFQTPSGIPNLNQSSPSTEVKDEESNEPYQD